MPEIRFMNDDAAERGEQACLTSEGVHPTQKIFFYFNVLDDKQHPQGIAGTLLRQSVSRIPCIPQDYTIIHVFVDEL